MGVSVEQEQRHRTRTDAQQEERPDSQSQLSTRRVLDDITLLLQSDSSSDGGGASPRQTRNLGIPIDENLVKSLFLSQMIINVSALTVVTAHATFTTRRHRHRSRAAAIRTPPALALALVYRASESTRQRNCAQVLETIAGVVRSRCNAAQSKSGTCRHTGSG